MGPKLCDPRHISMTGTSTAMSMSTSSCMSMSTSCQPPSQWLPGPSRPRPAHLTLSYRHSIIMNGWCQIANSRRFDTLQTLQGVGDKYQVWTTPTSRGDMSTVQSVSAAAFSWRAPHPGILSICATMILQFIILCRWCCGGSGFFSIKRHRTRK